MDRGTFATVITCMDGRVQLPVNKWAREEFGVDYVDTITEPGADLYLTENLIWQNDKIKSRVDISVNRHGSRNVVIVGHYDCAGNPVSDQKHKDLIRKSVEEIKAWKLPVRVVGLWVNDKWEPEVIVDTAKEKAATS
jgi:carbonic anhydrase